MVFAGVGGLARYSWTGTSYVGTVNVMAWARAAAVVVSAFAAVSLIAPTASAQGAKSEGLPQVVYSVPTKDPVVFITIDDGITRNRSALRRAERNNWPVTSFLTSWTFKTDPGYFARVSRRATVENHTVSHARLDRSSTNVRKEVCAAQRRIKKAFGARPTMLRPPYGYGPANKRMRSIARDCGITHIVMWNAVVSGGKLSRPGGELRAGDIVLLHYTANLDRDLARVERELKRSGLRAANLADYL